MSTLISIAAAALLAARSTTAAEPVDLLAPDEVRQDREAALAGLGGRALEEEVLLAAVRRARRGQWEGIPDLRRERRLLVGWRDLEAEDRGTAWSVTATETWATAWDTVLSLFDGVAEAGSGALTAVPGGAAVLAAIALMLGAQFVLVARWRTLARIDGNQARSPR